MSKDYSIGELREFLDTLIDNDDLNLSTARNIKNSTILLINSYIDGELVDEDTDVRELDVDLLITDHFRNAEAPPSTATVQAYKSRYLSAIERFLDYKKAEKKMSDDEHPVRVVTTRVRRSFASKPVTVLNSEVRGDIETIDVPIPIRPGMILTIPGIPTDLTNEEAERIASILKVYARPK